MGYVDYISSLSKPTCAPMVLGSEYDPDDYDSAHYLEDLVPGYRTNSVTGRESYESDISDMGMDVIDGDKFFSQRLKTRDISINYTIVTDTLEGYHNSYKILKKTLHEYEQGKWIFTDGQENVYYEGTASAASSDRVDASGSEAYAASGTITLHCSKPFAYSCKTYTAKSSDGIVSIDYDGTYKAYPYLTATVKQTSGYVLFTNDREAILKFGDTSGTSGTKYKSTYDFSYDFNSGSASTYFSAGDRSVTSAPSIPIGCNVTPNLLVMGKPSIHNQQIGGKENHTSYGSIYLSRKPSKAGNASWDGSAIRWTIPTAADNFFVHFGSSLILAAVNEEGGHYVQVLDETGANIMGMLFFHNNIGDQLDVRYILGNSVVKTFNNARGHSSDKINLWMHWYAQHSLQKSGDRFTFHFYTPQSFTNASLAAKKAKYIQFTAFGLNTGSYPLPEVNALRELSLRSDYMTYLAGNVPNPFNTGDSIQVWCPNMSVGVKSAGSSIPGYMDKPDYGVLGNDWEQFYLHPGANRIAVTTDNSDSAPELEVSYQKVFI